MPKQHTKPKVQKRDEPYFGLFDTEQGLYYYVLYALFLLSVLFLLINVVK